MSRQTMPFTTLSRFFINRNFALLWSGQVISNFGDYIFDTTLILWVVTIIARDQSWAPAAVSGVLIAASIPVLVIGPLAGVFADRWNQRQTLIRMDAIRAILIAFLLLVTGNVSLPFLEEGRLSLTWQIGIIYVVVFFASTCAQFFNPSILVLLNDIVEEPQRARATGLTQAMSSLAMLVGPPLAALLFFTAGVQWALLLNALSFVASFFLVLLISVPTTDEQREPEEQTTVLHEFKEGIHFYITNAVLMTLLITGILIIVFEGMFEALGVFFVTQNLHAPVSFYGFFGSALGGGLTLGAIIFGQLAQRLGVACLFWTSIVATGLLILVFARLDLFAPALVVIFLIGALFAATNVTYTPLLLHVTPRALLGRVGAVLPPVMTLASMLSIALAGWLESGPFRHLRLEIAGVVFGPIDTLFLIAGILTVIGGLYAMLNLRHVQLKSEDDGPQGDIHAAKEK